MGLRGLFGFGKPKVAVQVSGDVIIVRLPGTNFSVTYKRSNGALVAIDFGGTDVHRKIAMPVFLSQAWQAANAKARELRWIA
jgi:hypothetical protein